MPYRESFSQSAFGDGSDGDLHLQADANFAKGEYHLAGLTIDEGVVWSAQKWSDFCLPVVTVRCQSPVVLNGGISVANTTGVVSPGGGFVDAGDDANQYQVGEAGLATRLNTGAAGTNWLPIAGGCATQQQGQTPGIGMGDGSGNWLFPYLVPGVYGDAQNSLLDPTYPLTNLVGPGRPYRFCLGFGGMSWHANSQGAGGNGGSILLVYAPAIVFGPNGFLSADGGDGTYTTLDGGGTGGGGGGGYIEVGTRVPVSGTYAWKALPLDVQATGDRLKIHALGGNAGQDGWTPPQAFQGLNGVITYRTL